MAATKMTFTLDPETAARLDRIAARLGMSMSKVVREAVREYASRIGRLSEPERVALLATFDEVTARIPRRDAATVDRELAEVRRARRRGGRRSRAGDA
jgi:metal-responsive CopG/Arc/MetJ family transcriptional regulator